VEVWERNSRRAPAKRAGPVCEGVFHDTLHWTLAGTHALRGCRAARLTRQPSRRSRTSSN
jgi:hypothetical protein